jgi:hypothetical protein
VADLVIDGNEVMATLQIPPSRRVGEILQALFELVLEDPQRNTIEYLRAALPKVALEKNPPPVAEAGEL